MNLFGAPLHPLFVHGSVVFIPLAAIAAVVFVFKPEWRYLTRWPTAIINGIAFLALFTTRATGELLMKQTKNHQDLIAKHELMAGLLTAATVPLVLLTLFACWSFGSTTGLASGKGARDAKHEKFAPAVKWLILLFAIMVLVFTVLTGHSGATSAWAA